MDEAIDETGTVPCSIVGDDVEGRVHVEEQLRKEIREGVKPMDMSLSTRKEFHTRPACFCP